MLGLHLPTKRIVDLPSMSPRVDLLVCGQTFTACGLPHGESELNSGSLYHFDSIFRGYQFLDADNILDAHLDPDEVG